MITKIRLFFLKRKWMRLQAQITFLSRKLRQLKAEYTRKLEQEKDYILGRKHSLAQFDYFNREFSPLQDEMDSIAEEISRLMTLKRQVHTNIVGLQSDENFDPNACHQI